MVKYKTDSWHYRLATTYGRMNDYWRADTLCEYIKYGVRGLIMILAIVTMTSLIIYQCVVYPILWILINIQYGWDSLPYTTDTAIRISAIIWGILGTMVAVIGIMKIRTILKMVNDSFIGDVYHAIHNKVCFKIKFDDK